MGCRVIAFAAIIALLLSVVCANHLFRRAIMQGDDEDEEIPSGELADDDRSSFSPHLDLISATERFLRRSKRDEDVPDNCFRRCMKGRSVDFYMNCRYVCEAW